MRLGCVVNLVMKSRFTGRSSLGISWLQVINLTNVSDDDDVWKQKTLITWEKGVDLLGIYLNVSR